MQAKWLGRAFVQAGRRSEPMRTLLLLVIVQVALRCHPMSMLTAADAGAAASRDFDRFSSRRLGHYLRAQRQLLPAEELARLLPEDGAAIAETVSLLALDTEVLLAELSAVGKRNESVSRLEPCRRRLRAARGRFTSEDDPNCVVPQAVGRVSLWGRLPGQSDASPGDVAARPGRISRSYAAAPSEPPASGPTM
jgi:hypothetical protein